jgi:virginiamycin A acetyltransferase
VVTKDVPAYAVYGGVPARMVGFRKEASSLSGMDWWDWPLDKLADGIPHLMKPDAADVGRFSIHRDMGWSDE